MRSCALTTPVVVASRDPGTARQFAAQFDCAATDYEELIARDDVDAVYIPSPPAVHATWARAALLAGKHVLTEKPLAADFVRAREIVALARERGRVLRENFMFLHHPQHESVREILRAGQLGELRSFHGAFCIPPLPDTDVRYRADLGGGALLDVGVYPLRAAQFFLGPSLRVAGATLRMGASGVDLAGQVLLVSETGVLACLEFGFQHSYASRYALWGSTARLVLDRAYTPPADHAPRPRLHGQSGTEELTLTPAHQFELSVASFARAVREGRTAASPAESVWCDDAVETVALVDEIRRHAVRIHDSGEGSWK
jgi:NDP-hexose-3-ketoreductase